MDSNCGELGLRTTLLLKIYFVRYHNFFHLFQVCHHTRLIQKQNTFAEKILLSDYQLAVICLGKRLAVKGQLPVPSDYRLAVKGQYQS